MRVALALAPMVRQGWGEEGGGGVDPGQEAPGVVHRGAEGGKADQTARAKLVGHEGLAIGGDADEALRGLGLAVTEVGRQVFLSVGGLATKIALELEDSAAEEGVGAAAG